MAEHQCLNPGNCISAKQTPWMERLVYGQHTWNMTSPPQLQPISKLRVVADGPLGRAARNAVPARSHGPAFIRAPDQQHRPTHYDA